LEFEGGCYTVRNLTEGCNNDKECILGANDFARCVNATCQCHTSEEANFVADESGGTCMMEKAECNTTSFSVFAVTVSCSAALFVMLVVLYTATKPVFDKHAAQPKL